MSANVDFDEIRKAIAEIFHVDPRSVCFDRRTPPHIAGRVYFDHCDATLTYDSLARLAELLGHHGIDIEFMSDTPSYSAWTPGTEAGISLRFKPPAKEGE